MHYSRSDIARGSTTSRQPFSLQGGAIGHQPLRAHALELAALLFDLNPDLLLQRLEPGIPIPHLEGGFPVQGQPRVGDRAVLATDRSSIAMAASRSPFRTSATGCQQYGCRRHGRRSLCNEWLSRFADGCVRAWPWPVVAFRRLLRSHRRVMTFSGMFGPFDSGVLRDFYDQSFRQMRKRKSEATQLEERQCRWSCRLPGGNHRDCRGGLAQRFRIRSAGGNGDIDHVRDRRGLSAIPLPIHGHVIRHASPACCCWARWWVEWRPA